MKPTFIEKYTNYIETITEKDSIKYKLSLIEEILYLILSSIIFYMLLIMFVIVAIPILITLIIILIPYIIYCRYKAVKSMKESEEEEC